MKKGWIIGAIILCLLMAGCAKKDASPQPEDGVSLVENTEAAEINAAPDFSATLLSGETYTLSEQKGKVVLLNIWATWCSPCEREMPAFETLQEKYGDRLSIICVNCMEEIETVQAFIDENGYTFPVAPDPDGKICDLYYTGGIPYTVIIDKDGNVAEEHVGASSADGMAEAYSEMIDKLL